MDPVGFLKTWRGVQRFDGGKNLDSYSTIPKRITHRPPTTKIGLGRSGQLSSKFAMYLFVLSGRPISLFVIIDDVLGKSH